MNAMSKQELESVAQAMVAKGKGILAADESMGTSGSGYRPISPDIWPHPLIKTIIVGIGLEPARISAMVVIR